MGIIRLRTTTTSKLVTSSCRLLVCPKPWVIRTPKSNRMALILGKVLRWIRLRGAMVRYLLRVTMLMDRLLPILILVSSNTIILLITQGITWTILQVLKIRYQAQIIQEIEVVPCSSYTLQQRTPTTRWVTVVNRTMLTN